MADGPLSRRDFVKAAVIAASAAALGIGALSQVLPILSGTPPTRMPIARRNGDALTPITLRDLEGPAVAFAVGEWQLLPAIVFKVRTETLRASALRRGYNTGQFALQHPTESDMAVVAYDAKCTHLGCTVGFNATLGAAKDVTSYDADAVSDGRIMCPCHQSQFDVFDLARNLPGMPAARPLDALSIRFGDPLDGSPTIEGMQRFRQATYRSADQQGDGASFHLAG